ncbi:ATP/GTP-binding protein [Streptomyces kaniharaensis]|uniref:ATP/GTP-binding protein n=2 Tax=Streptomyces kaniharaensis TaxID=212423 RepID=A0A6N7L2Y1_9ACTN|nr:ATP/GTP-binding protein [Streptomyces kaniharaensis]
MMTSDVCIVVTDTGGGGPGGNGSSGGGSGGGNSGGSGAPQPCMFNGVAVPCSSSWGWYNAEDGCYYKVYEPQPPAGDPLWQGHQPGDGAVYGRTCYLAAAGGGIAQGPKGGFIWLQTPPPGYGGGVSPAALAQEIFATMKFDVPDIGTAPEKGGKGVVGMPVWLWATPSKTSWGQWRESKAAGGLSVTVTAQVTQIDWSMGDGGSRTCTVPGTPYTSDKGGAASPDCGYRYTTTSAGKPDGKFQVSATTTWAVHWEGGGQQGDLQPIKKTSTTELTIGEVQVLN